MTKLKKALIVVIVFVCFCAVGYFLSNRPVSDDEYVLVSSNPENVRKIVVAVEGEVKKPGKYSVPYGCTVHDVLYHAKGVTSKADLSALDLGKRIFEESSIVVPEMQYVKKSDENKNTFCNINTASYEELVSLDGIGDVIAQNIINYREVYGPFKSVDDILNVEGIGEKKYKEIKDKITVGGN